ncbi:MAG: Gfo/Idh/MocA family oxidoreductase [Bacteroidales bacterium]|nr:Gfo/Idh/MocA family oxidoreductase [Bacteroidales bacterium]
MERRTFIKASGAFAVGGLLINPSATLAQSSMAAKKRIAMVGTGVRGIGFWGKTLVENYSDILEFVGLCDINPGRLAFAKKYMGVNCNTYTDFDAMMKEAKPEMLIVTTVDATHHEFIVKGLEYGAEVFTEKPLTTDEVKCQLILDAERRTGRKVRVGFNYRYGTLFTKLKELLAEQRVGLITSVDFHWYLNTHHGADYFRRWHGFREKSGTLLVHKATHHFDLLNWWLDSDPVEVHAYGKLEHYGKNNTFRGMKCRGCEHREKCKFFWDMTKDDHLMRLYADNEQHDGYIRDSCVWRNEIDIFDKMAVQIKYANDVQVSYSLTAYSPYEGLTIAFNGMNGRIDSWQDLPWRQEEKVSQADRHAREMNQAAEPESTAYDEIVVSENFGKSELVQVPLVRGGHGGGDKRLQDKLFRNPDAPDPLKHAAGLRDGAMSILIGVAARKSIDEGRPVKIAELTDLTPHPTRNQ